MPRDKSSLVYSAHSLQAFVDCQRRFELHYLEQLKWPAVGGESMLERERFLEAGRRFHEMIQQDLLGIPVKSPELHSHSKIVGWWENYLTARPAYVAGTLYPEKTLVGSITGHPLTGTYDLIAIGPDGKARIFDWKTWKRSEKHDRDWLLGRLQTRVYRYLLVDAGAALNDGNPISPGDIQMVYWFAEHPGEPEVFEYTTEQYEDDQKYLSTKIEQISQMPAGEFELVGNDLVCCSCVYQSYCGRCGRAGAFNPEEADFMPEFSLLGDLDDYEAVAF